MTGPRLVVVRLPHGDDLPLPAYESDGASGLDLRAAVPEHSPVTLAPTARALVPTGLRFALPEGYEGQVRPRSGLAMRNGITVLNSPGTIDADYRGELKVILINLGEGPFEITRGMRIAQFVVAPVVRVGVEAAEMLPESRRGAGGFGSTGTG